jgi:hypothetical protein
MAIRKSSNSGIPFGPSESRPSPASVGQTYYNGTLGYLEIYTSSGWIAATGANDFSLNLSGQNTVITFTQSYSSGSYSIVSASNDLTLDIYAYGTDGSLAGYTNTKSFTATQRFNKMVILGGSTGDVLSFSYKTTYATSTSTTDTTSGPYITSISPSSAPKVDDTVTIAGGNFASDVAVSFSASGYSTTPAKSIVRTSSTSLIVTRPDNFPTSTSPYTVTVTNPSISNQPAGSSVNVASNSVTAGSSPVWTTSNSVTLYTNLTSNSVSLLATDADAGSTITYSYVSGTLPSGVTYNSSTSVLSGVPSSSGTNTYTIRATDSGGNYVDRTFTITSTTIGTASNPAPSPKVLKNGGASSGLYYFSNPGYNGGAAFQAFADMSVGDGYIILCGVTKTDDSIASWSEFGTAATGASGTPGFRNNFYLPSANILSSWTGDTNNKFIVGQASNNGSDLTGAAAKNWFVLDLTPAIAKTWFDNNPGTPEFTGDVSASSSGSGLGNYSWSSTHGNEIWQMYKTSGGAVNSRLWMETRTGGGDTNHSPVVFSTGEGNYYKGNADTGGFGSSNYYRWVFMGFSPSNS